MKTVRFIPRYQAESMAALPHGVIISIYDQSQDPAALDLEWRDRLNLRFHDSDGSHSSYEHFTAEHAALVLNFMTKHADVEHVVVHCQMGVSRSAAVAMFIAEQQGRVLFQQEQRIDADRPWSRYNSLVYRLLNQAVYASNEPHPFESLPFDETSPS